MFGGLWKEEVIVLVLFGSVSKIESSMNWVDVSVFVEIKNMLGMKLADNVRSESVRFDVSAKLEEKERRSGKVIVLFALTVRTKPSVVKYEVGGSAVLSGKDALISKMLEVDPESEVPFVFHRVYQHVFTAIYMLASLMGTIYPPSDLLSSGGQGIPVKSLVEREQANVPRVANTVVSTETVEAGEVPETAEATPTYEGATTEPTKPPEPAVEREQALARQTEDSVT